MVVLAGGRLDMAAAENAGRPRRTTRPCTAFSRPGGAARRRLRAGGQAGTGLRFPSLSERFFTGVTGRGFVAGNPALDPERSLNADLGLRWYGDRLFLAGYVFRNEIDDYIERVETAPEELTFAT